MLHAAAAFFADRVAAPVTQPADTVSTFDLVMTPPAPVSDAPLPVAAGSAPALATASDPDLASAPPPVPAEPPRVNPVAPSEPPPATVAAPTAAGIPLAPMPPPVAAPRHQAPPQTPPRSHPSGDSAPRPTGDSAPRPMPAAKSHEETPPAPATPALPEEAHPSPAWLAGVGGWLRAHRSYPETARQRGQEGVVVIRFTADRMGHVLAVSLVRSSGSDLLDQAALTLLKDAALPPFPPDMLLPQQSVTVPIRYRLEQ